MKKLSAKGQRWLKGFHVFFSCMWVGAAVSLCSNQFFVNPSDGLELYGVMSTLKFIDDFVIIPGAIGSLLTALIYSIWTNWGWFKHRWVTVKWVIILYGVIFGTWGEGLSALSNPAYLHNRTMLYWFGSFQVLTLIFAVFISVLKPWKAKKGST